MKNTKELTAVELRNNIDLKLEFKTTKDLEPFIRNYRSRKST